MLVVGPVLRVVALGGVLALVLAACHGRHAAAGSGTADSDRSLASAVTALLDARAGAVVGGSEKALSATAAPDADPAVKALRSRLGGLVPRTWTYQVRATSAGPGDSEVTVQALLKYRLESDPIAEAPATALRRLVLTPDPSRSGGWLVRSDRPDGAWLPWDIGPVIAGVGSHAAVLDVRTVPGTGIGAVLADTSTAAAAVSAVWGAGWRTPVVVATDGADELSRLTGRPAAAVSGLVAETTADRVYVDMPAWLALPAAGRQVLLTHEVTHLATGAAADAAVPQWLEEGFADYVGFSGSGIPVRTAAAALLDPLAAGGPLPGALPADRDFSAGGAAEARAYAGAWLVCRLVAASGGVRELVAVYRQTSAGHGTPAANADAALRQVTGRGVAGWIPRWRAYLSAIAARPAGTAAGSGAVA